jgi:imidazolonepropionase-like amidohydrolase
MSLLLTGAAIIDGLGSDPIARGFVLTEGDRIADVGTDGARPGASRASQHVELSGLTLLPGLIDAHTHLGFSSEMMAMQHVEVSVAERAADIFRNLRAALEAGFTAARDCGGIDHGVLRAVGRGLVPGPRIWACASALHQTGGHGILASPLLPPDAQHYHWVRGLTAVGGPCDGVDAVTKAARECFRQGASFLKIVVTGGVVSRTDNLDDTQFTVQEIAAAVAEARARNTYVTAHAHNVAGIRNAIVGGVKCVEHGTGIDEEIAAMMAADGVSLVPTLTIAQDIVDNYDRLGLPPEMLGRVGDTMKRMSDGLLAAREAGVLVGSGSDLVGPVQDHRGQEIGLKARLIGAMAAICSATSVNARIMRVADTIGSIETGKLADLIAVDFDPLAQPELFRDPARVILVVKGGEIVKDMRK